MNKKQKIVCLVVIFIVVGMGIYPPFHIQLLNGFINNLGYGWFFSPPVFSQIAGLPNAASFSSVDTALLNTQWFGTLIVGFFAIIFLRDRF